MGTIISRHGYEGLIVATMMAGILLVAMGLACLGALVQFIPYPVTVGFTAGITLIIATTQIPKLFGFHLTNEPADFLDKWLMYEHELSTANPWSILIDLAANRRHWHPRQVIPTGCEEIGRLVPDAVA